MTQKQRMKKTPKDYFILGEACEVEKSFKQAAQYYLLSARGNARCNRVDQAIYAIEKAQSLYLRELSRSVPNSILFLLAKLLDMNGESGESNKILEFLIKERNDIKALILIGNNCISSHSLNVLKKYIDYIDSVVEGNQLQLQQKIDLMLIRASYEFLQNSDLCLIRKLKDFHLKNNNYLQTNLNSMNYIRWIYNLQNRLAYLPETTLEERIHFLFEAETLAKKYKYKKVLVYVYNVLGVIYQDINIHQSKHYVYRSESIANEIGDKVSVKRAINNLIDFSRLSGDNQGFIRNYAIGKNLCGQINNQQDFWLYANEIKYLLYIEKYEEALEKVNELTIFSRSLQNQDIREKAFLLKFHCMILLEKKDQVNRMYPAIRRICMKKELQDDLILYDGKMVLLFGDEHKLHYNALESMVPRSVEKRIQHYITLIKITLQKSNPEKGLKIAHKLKLLIFDTGYFGYLCYYYYYSANLYKQKNDLVKAIVNFQRALTKCKVIGNERKIVEITEQIKMKHMSSQVNLIDQLVKNEILFDSIRLLQSSLKLKTLVKNLAFILFEQMILDKVYLKLNVDTSDEKFLVVNNQLQLIQSEIDPVEAVVNEFSFDDEHSKSFTLGESYYYAVPMSTHHRKGVVVVEMSSRNKLQSDQVQFLIQLMEFASAQFESAIMYNAMIKDDLTGLYNRNFFIEYLKKEFDKSISRNTDLAIIMIDLDNFSEINNTLGHMEGDRILIEVSSVIGQSLRKHDIVGRYGGEEIIVILPNTSGFFAKKIVDRLVSEIRKVQVSHDKTLTASLGVASFDEDLPISIEDFLNKADFAERYAKENGKNQSICHWEIRC